MLSLPHELVCWYSHWQSGSIAGESHSAGERKVSLAGLNTKMDKKGHTIAWWPRSSDIMG